MIRKVLLLSAVGLLVLGASAAYASFPPIDLTTSGATVTSADGTVWTQLVNQPTGTGVYNPFLRLQATGTEAGMNTDGDAHVTYDDVAGIWTHGITLGQLNTITQNGNTYYSFSCDINEPNGGGQNFLSLDELRIYTLAGSSSLTSEAAVTGAGGLLKYNMDGGVAGNQTVYLDYNLAAGSGHDDFQVLIPTSYFAGASSTDQVYFYSAFGETTGMAADLSSGDGFEEWHALLGQAPPPPSLPEPSTVMILGTGLLGLAATRIRKK